MADLQEKDSNIATGFSNFLFDDHEGNKLGFSGIHVASQPKNMDSTLVLGAEVIDTNQEHKRRCFEKLVVRTERTTEENVEDVKCSLQVEVIDDTALIEATTAAVSGFKSCSKNETDVGYRNKKSIGVKKIKQENDRKKRRNKGSKKQGKSCSTKCVNETKFNGQIVEDQGVNEKKIPEGKAQKMLRKMCGKVRLVYQKKDTKGLKLVPTDLEEEHHIVENQNVPIKIIDGAYPYSEMVNSKASKGTENENESTTQLVETQTVKNQKDDGLNPKIAVHTEKNEEKDQEVCKNTTVGSKKMAYSREEIESLRFVGEEEQNQKWAEVYSGLSPSVAKEYTSLVVDTDNRQPQRYIRGSTRHAILSMPPVLPLCSSSNDRKFAPYGRGFRVNFH